MINKKEDKQLKPIEVPEIEILDDTPEDVKTDYYFRLYTKHSVDLENLKLEIKKHKEVIKESDFEPARLVDAMKYLAKDGVNKKGVEADTIDVYMEELQKSEKGEDNKFDGLDSKLKRLMDLEDEQKKSMKAVEDKMGEVGLEKKALKGVVEDFIKENNPHIKPPKVDVVLDGNIEKYNSLTKLSKKDIIPLPFQK